MQFGKINVVEDSVFLEDIEGLFDMVDFYGQFIEYCVKIWKQYCLIVFVVMIVVKNISLLIVEFVYWGGEQVKYFKFGEGQVFVVVGVGEWQEVMVYFVLVGMKKLMVKFVNLMKLQFDVVV